MKGIGVIVAEGKDFKAVVSEVKLAYDIVDYVQQAGISLKQRGATYLGLCPFHNERTPSFNVNSNFQNYRCFGCGANGDLISFVENYERLDFMEAVRKLAEEKNIEIEVTNEDSIDYKSLRACLKTSANFYVKEFRKLEDDHPAKKEITKDDRGLSLRGYIYGYAPEGRNTLFNYLKQQGFKEDTILLSGVCKKSEQTGIVRDFWQGRLMFVITDISGRPIGFSGRKLYETDKMGKYVNSSDGPLFDKSNALFNIQKAKKKASDDGIIYVSEGQFDTIAMIESGIDNVVASSGTAFTNNQALMCRRLVSESGKIVFCFDGDEAGKKAALKVFKNSPIIHSQSYVVAFPEGMDPCDYRVKNGSDALKEYVETTEIPLVEFVMNTIAEKYNFSSALDRNNYVTEVSKILATIAHVPLRESYVRRVALNATTPVDSVRNIVAGVKTQESYDEPVIIEDDDEESSDSSSLRNYDAVDANQEDDYVSYDDFVSLIENDMTYSAAARLCNIVFSDPRFLPAFLAKSKDMPVGFESIVMNMQDYKEDADKVVFIPELFDRSDVVRYIMDSNLFPLSHLMDLQSLKKHFVYLQNYVRKAAERENSDFVKSNIAKILDQTDNVDKPVDLLRKALAKEEALLKKKA